MSSNDRSIGSPESRPPPGRLLTPEQQREVSVRLREILGERAVIEQAKGVLMVLYRLDADAAFAKLRKLSMNENIQVHALAERVVEEASRLSDTLPPWVFMDRMFRTIREQGRQK